MVATELKPCSYGCTTTSTFSISIVSNCLIERSLSLFALFLPRNSVYNTTFGGNCDSMLTTISVKYKGSSPSSRPSRVLTFQPSSRNISATSSVNTKANVRLPPLGLNLVARPSKFVQIITAFSTDKSLLTNLLNSLLRAASNKLILFSSLIFL